MQLPSVSVCIVTYERPEFVDRCLRSLEGEREQLLEVVVVDASAERRLPTALHPQDTYVHAPDLAGWMTKSRNRALLEVEGEIICSLDDDVAVRPGWARHLRRVFAETDAAAVVGRTINGLPGEETYDRKPSFLSTGRSRTCTGELASPSTIPTFEEI